MPAGSPSSFQQAALLVRLTVLMSGVAPVTHLASPRWCEAGSRCLGRLPQSCFLSSSAVAALGNSDLNVQDPSQRPRWCGRSWSLQTQLLGGIPAQPFVVAQFCICPVGRWERGGLDRTCAFVSNGGFLSESRGRVGTGCGACDGENSLSSIQVPVIADQWL